MKFMKIGKINIEEIIVCICIFENVLVINLGICVESDIY